MATEVLRPQDCLIERIRVPPASFYRRKSYYGNPNNSSSNYNNNNNYNSCSNPNPRSSRRPAAVRQERQPEQRRNNSVSKRSSSDDLKAMKKEKMTILRRGESLDSKIKSSGSGESLKKEGGGLVVCGTQRLGPAPEMVPKRLGIVDLRVPTVGNSDVYAGSAFAFSPAPSSLPLPSFSKKKQESPVAVAVDDSATRDLRRLLRIA